MEKIGVSFDKPELARFDKAAKTDNRKRATMVRVLALKGLEQFEKNGNKW